MDLRMTSVTIMGGNSGDDLVYLHVRLEVDLHVDEGPSGEFMAVVPLRRDQVMKTPLSEIETLAAQQIRMHLQREQ